MSRIRRAFLAAPLALVAACGSGDRSENVALGVAQGVLAGIFNRDAEAPDVRRNLNRAALDAAGVPLLLAEFDNRVPGTAFGLLVGSANGAEVQWRTQDELEITRRDGLLVITQGFGFDLHSADVSAIVAGFRSGGGTALTRVHRYLDGENEIRLRAYACDLAPVGGEVLTFYDRSFRTVRWLERCYGTDGSFDNEYWIDQGGLVRHSRQWIGPELGHLQLDLVAG